MKTNNNNSKKPFNAACSPMFISYLKRGERFTTDKDIAIRVGKETSRPPIEFISPKLREVYLKAWPELGRVVQDM